MTQGPLERRKILVVEDEYFIATDVAKKLAEMGAEVVGPAGAVDVALALIDAVETLDAAVIDINLSGEMAYPVADALKRRDIPFIFATGYDRAAIPPAYADVLRFEKPVDAVKIVQALFSI